MAPKTLEATTPPPNEPTSPAPGSGDGQDPGARVGAQFEEGEAEALAADDAGELADTPSKRNIAPPAEKAPEVRAEGESADDAGEEPEGESPESNGEEPEGEESDEGDAEEREAKEQFDLALKMAGGDRRKALAILQTAMGEAAKQSTPVEPVKVPEFDAKAEAKQFYKDVAEKGEEEAFALHLDRLAKAQARQVEAIRKDSEIRQKAEKAAAAEVAALDKLTKGAWRKDTGFMAWYQQPAYSGLPGVDAYTLYAAKRTARKGSENGASAAAKVVAAKKEKAAGAAASIPGGRPAGPNAPRPHVSSVELEMRESQRQEGQRLRALP